MALVLADRVKETSTTAGTGTLTLSGASSGFQSFAVVGNGNTTYYAISDAATGQWEVGIGTYSNGATGAAQTASPNSGSWTTDGSLVGSNITWYSPSDTGYIAGDYVLLFDQTAGSSFFYYGQITLIQFAGGFGWAFSADILSSDGTPNGDPSSSWNMQESTGITLSRTTVLSSSASGALVAFGAGVKDVFVTYPSEKGVWLDATGKFVQTAFTNLSATGTATISTASLTSGTIATAPTGIADIANKAYVDLMSSTSISVHAPVKYESPSTTGNLTATYVNGGTTPTWITITGGTTLDTASAHGLSVNDVIVFGSTTNGLTAGTPYFVYSVPTGTSITLSLNYNGAEITTLTNGTGLTITSLANSGIGATLTNAGTKAALVIDGVTVSATDRVLIYNQTNGFENGVYTVTTVGTPDPGGTNWVLTRATDSDTYAPNSTVSLGQGDYFFVQAGNTGAGESYILTTIGTIVFGTTGLVFNQFGSSQVYTAGTGLTLTNTEFSITPVGTASTYGSASQVPVITTNASGQVSSVTNTTIAITGSQVSGNITGQAGSVANALTAGTYLTSGGTYDGSVARTFTVDATSANTASKVVARDASGDFSAGTITAALSGNATTATTATNVAGGAANQIVYNSASGTTTFVVAPTTSSTYLGWNGAAFAWGAPPAVAQAGGVIWENSLIVSANYTLATGNNGFSVGPITINSGVSVTVPSGQRWVVI